APPPYLPPSPTRRSSDLPPREPTRLAVGPRASAAPRAPLIECRAMSSRQPHLAPSSVSLRAAGVRPILGTSLMVVLIATVGCGRSEEHTSELQSRSDLVC